MSASDTPQPSKATVWASGTLALAKLAAWLLSGSTSLLAEGLRSLADTGAQARERRAQAAAPSASPSSTQSPLPAMLFYAVAGVIALVAGNAKLHNPHPIELWWLPLIVIGAAVAQQLATPFLPRTRLERVSGLVGLSFALAGVVVTVITGNGIFDGVATMLIGALLLAVALLRSLGDRAPAVAEEATAEETALIEAELLRSGDFERVMHLSTAVKSSGEMMIGARVALAPGVTIREFATLAYRAERQIRQAVPAASVITLEPDVYVDPQEKLPSTEAIVFLSED